MKFSKSLISTLREEPKEAETKGHRLLLRGGFIKQLAAGIHIYLPLGWRVLLRITQIIREEMDRIGAQELLMPAISPREVWEESGRWQEYGDDMFRLKDRKGRDYCLCPTHEEIITAIARNKIKSYRDLPQIWYQIQTKFRDELRPRFGIIRSRQFIMKDSYSLDVDEAGLDYSYKLHEEAYKRIFKRCGLNFEIVEASGGLMGGGESKEFVAQIDGGEATIARCSKCNFRADTEAALGKGEFFTGEDIPVTEVATPERRTIEEVSDFLKVSRKNLVKSIFYTAPDKPPILILLRGDYEINENIIKAKFGFSYNPAGADEIIKYFNAEPGFIGPIGIKGVKIYADELLKDTRGMITGANRNGYHIKGLNIARDIEVAEFLNLRKVKPGDRCLKCGGKLQLYQGLELGQIFKLGTKYSTRLGATFLDEKGKLRPIIMGSYGIGLERIMACACEQKADDAGAVWPISIAPFEVYLLILNPEEPTIKKVSDEIIQSLTNGHFSVIIDNRNLSAGIKFNDSELLGIPIRVTIGPKGIKEDRFDIYIRETKEIISSSKAQIVEQCLKIKEELYRRLNV
ncbi:proline--tRNA ligase [candidate division WOR-3 bacterium 4484_100]|uniref:Proline--tRNA ligase n=1 Tax=candidate division WOR-3 bacterium 4484_100 TaxID=1936077 RepID=A0A1V4QHY9_UNCW3|nr:MAG: proline--tRNA ligase [candidate division WOR-3 bacterium 4484_100]